MLIRFSVIVNTSKGQLHSVHWASSDLGQTQFEQMVLKCFSWGPVHFFPNSSSVYCQHGTMQTASWMLADFLTMTPFWTRRFMHNVDSCILQIVYFPYKHVSLRATVLLVFPLLKTTESGCLRSTDPALCLRGISTQNLYNFFFFFFGTFNFAKQPFAMHNWYNCGPEWNVVLQGNITQMLTTSRCWAILTRGEKTPHVSALVQSKAWSALGKSFFSIALRDLGWSSRQLRLPGSLKVLTLTGVVYALLVRLVIL